ncbi:hypothetical protein KIN20_015931 [Parelaphostrongylus tenuis]|uniref:Uncharacterized protein n=1 Tax=Parelaphostrongylus tenuis TaxID=148309 RepID=A0AAD5QQB4_PARTN|nr:hypothetical protein KIN20_015931 [Parelaphostrongylus tenuis]
MSLIGDTSQLKISHIIVKKTNSATIRALFFPIVFRRFSDYPYARACLLFGFLLAVVDLALEFSLSPIDRAPNCPSQECFQNEDFSKYLGISNMAMGFTVIVLTILFLAKLRAIQRKPQPAETMESKGSKFKQANLNCIGILLTSLAVTLPSVVIGVSGKTIASAVGPFYFLSLLCAGLLSNIVHVVLNKEMRELSSKRITTTVTTSLPPVKSITRFITQQQEVN